MNKSEDGTPETANVLSDEDLQSVTGGLKLPTSFSLESVLKQYREINVASIQRAVLNRGSLIAVPVSN